jgi:signal transduction histidine kinase
MGNWIQMVMKKRILSLRIIFFEYLFGMALMLVLSFSIPFALFNLGINTGLYTYANFSEIQAKNMEHKIAEANPFNSALVPASCTYVYVSADYAVLQSNMMQEEMKNAVAYAQGKYSPPTNDDCFFVIKRDDGFCILHYYIRSRYTVDWMNRYLPSMDVLLIICFIFNCLAGCFIVTALFAKRLKIQLHPLLSAIRKIKEQDLDFEVQQSGIKEFNDILLSILDMKSELKHSLEEQWRMEQTKKEQTSALAHDIKTPLTIIKGNAELLHDSNLTEEQQKYAGYILKNVNRMEYYLKMLIDLTKAEAGYSLHLENVSTRTFLDNIYSQMNALASVKELKIEIEEKDLPDIINLDVSLMQRAIMNIISNAVDFSPSQGLICFYTSGNNDKIRFSVIDSGKGFSPEELKNATKKFYQGDSSRSSKLHYGMGLFIADSIVRQHGGTLLIANSPVAGGGMVTIEV